MLNIYAVCLQMVVNSFQTSAGRRLGTQDSRKNVNRARVMFVDDCTFLQYDDRKVTGSQEVGADANFLYGCF